MIRITFSWVPASARKPRASGDDPGWRLATIGVPM